MPEKEAKRHIVASFSSDLVFALDISERAGKIALRHFQHGVETDTKDDGSPVTVADRECERLIREAIAAKFPGDAILGEEEGETQGSQADSKKEKSGQSREFGEFRKWIVDPIDGTYGYARGIPIFATLLALEVNGEIQLGVVHNPAQSELYFAEKGFGAFKNGQRIHVSKISDLMQSQFNFGGINRVLKLGLWDGFTKLVATTCRQRGMGDYLGFAQVFEGKAEAHLEVGVKPWDLAPMKIIVEEAGGSFDDLDGGKSVYTGNCLITNGRLRDQFLAPLKRSG